MNRASARSIISANLKDPDGTFYTEQDLNDSLQDAYDDIIANTMALITSVDLNWVGDLSYYIWPEHGITDLLAPIAIFNDETNMFLTDNLHVRDFDKIRLDWELWNGSPQFWAPVAFDRIAITPKHLTSQGRFKLYYWQTAPTISDDSTAYSLQEDVTSLLTNYSTADLIEQAEEYAKAGTFWAAYFAQLEMYKARVKQLAKHDMLLRV